MANLDWCARWRHSQSCALMRVPEQMVQSGPWILLDAALGLGNMMEC